MPYNEVPSRRMPWDADGSVSLHAISFRPFPAANTPPTKQWTATDTSDVQAMNDEDTTAVINQTRNYPWTMHCVIFPEKRELDGWYQNVMNDTAAWESYSTDTTNGFDGTWDTAVVAATRSTVVDHYRDNISSLAVQGVKAVMSLDGEDVTNRSSGRRRVHLYGVISPGETPDRIIFLDTENADAKFTKVLDFGDKPRGQTTTRTFKIKNNSSSKTINTIQVTAEALYLNAGGWYTFGDDGVNYQGTFAVGNLGPGATKLLYLKQIIPDAETLGVQAGRIKVSHASVT